VVCENKEGLCCSSRRLIGHRVIHTGADSLPCRFASHRSARAASAYRLKAGERLAVPDPSIAQLVVTSVGASSPAWDRLTEIAKERKTGE
jgi:hypothetical protein